MNEQEALALAVAMEKSDPDRFRKFKAELYRIWTDRGASMPAWWKYQSGDYLNAYNKVKK